MTPTGGRWKSINPATEEVVETFEVPAEDEAFRMVNEADEAFGDWSRVSFDDRAKVLNRVGELLRGEVDHHASIMTREMGKPIAEAASEVEKCAWGCDYYAEHAEGFLAPEPMPSDSPLSRVVFEPMGVVMAIMPWNFPYWQVFRFGAPALMAGNSVVLKHAPNVPRCALEIEDLFRRAGLPDGAFRSVFAEIDVAESLIGHPLVRAVTLTGSERAGSRVAEIAGRHLKKTVLELGGSDPFIVLDDADLEGAIETGAKSRFQNAGQSCIAAKRFILTERIAQDFEDRLVAEVERLVVGDPTDPETQIGPLAREDLRDNLAGQVEESVAAGANVLTGGRPVEGRGYFYQPTVLSQVDRDMPVMREETFGPVAVLTRVAGPEEAIQVANDTPFGLGGNVWTSNLDLAREMARRIYTGGVFINGMTHSDPRLPFGGVKRSGWGRELSKFGIREFVNIKTIWEPEKG
jgi:acyl-CoA reductase-like NAD-dependent aldehyde dehydrogenase